MTTAESADAARVASPRRVLLVGICGVLALLVIFALGLAWAKWIPYAQKANHLSRTGSWSGGPLFADSGKPGAAPSLTGAWQFTWAYVQSVWKGFLVALLIAAAFDALVPRAWLLRVMNRRTRAGQAAAGGVAGLPSLMCTCCAAPLTAGLRQRGVSTTAALAYWLANPLLNPAVLAFLFLVLPWRFGVVRLIVGAAVVFAATVLVGRLAREDSRPASDAVPALSGTVPADPRSVREFPGRFARSLLRLALVMVPAYFVVVLVLGYLSGWLSDFAGLDARLGVAAVLLCAVVGTLLVIPTGGEIPVVLALSAAGVAAGTAGALLITLPAVSVPSMVLVGRALSWRVTAAIAGTVVVAGLAGGLLLWAMA